MRRAIKTDRQNVVDIITGSFSDNPGVNWMLKGGTKQSLYLKRFASYAFTKAFQNNGVLISSHEKGVALYYIPNREKFSVREFIHQLFFAFTSIRPDRLTKVVKRESYRKKMRPASGSYIYFWLLGVPPNGKGAGFELKNALMKEAQEKKLPIYLETTLQRNCVIYERIGFKTYHEWVDEKEDIHFWFMKWEPQTLEV